MPWAIVDYRRIISHITDWLLYIGVYYEEEDCRGCCCPGEAVQSAASSPYQTYEWVANSVFPRIYPFVSACTLKFCVTVYIFLCVLEVGKMDRGTNFHSWSPLTSVTVETLILLLGAFIVRYSVFENEHLNSFYSGGHVKLIGVFNWF